jgi:pyruvate dehydrogenase E1 component
MSEKEQILDIDPAETAEWREALEAIRECEGPERAAFVFNELQAYAQQLGLSVSASGAISIKNTVEVTDGNRLPAEDLEKIERLQAYMRWNATLMVLHGGKVDSALGGHIASYTSMATLYEVGLHYYFRAQNENFGGDLVYYQGHSVPGIYARSFLEGRLTVENLQGYRREYSTDGLSSYPHPYLKPNYWQFPTVSMGLGPLMAIYQAQFLKYMENRGFIKKEDRKVWAFCGDGEMNEPESVGAIHIAKREKLDNLIFVINCNLQRLDGTVWGNGQIMEQFENLFTGAGWRVIKVRWGSKWCELFAKDTSGKLQQLFTGMCDGNYQTMTSRGPAYLREQVFGTDPDLQALVADMSDDDLMQLVDGGHDAQQVYAAYQAAMQQTGTGKPTVVLCKTVKGFGMGASGEGQNIAHNKKKMTPDELEAFGKRFGLPVTKEQCTELTFLKPEGNSPEMQFLREQREKLGGVMPARQHHSAKLTVPGLDAFHALFESTGEKEISSTMAFSRAVSVLLKDKNVKDRLVPIFADEARTFGMESLFRQLGMYAADGQLYEPEDKDKLLYYREDNKGQVLQMGLSEAGSMAAWIAAGSAYSVHGEPMIPIYSYYSMFGFQRCGDLVWAAADQHCRGFLFGGLSGRTSLPGEGLQHQDGQNLMMFGMVPSCITYDPCFAYETAVVVQNGMQRMYADQEDVFFYLTGTNENYAHPAMPDCTKPEDIVKGLSLYQEHQKPVKAHVQLIGGGVILREVIEAAAILEKDYQVTADVWSGISFSELRRDVDAVERYNRLHPDAEARQTHVQQCLRDRSGPVIAATDQIKLYANQIRQAVPGSYYVLGTDGFGRSDTRPALRDFFEVDSKMIVYTALKALVDDGKFKPAALQKAVKQLGVDVDRADPTTC